MKRKKVTLFFHAILIQNSEHALIKNCIQNVTRKIYIFIKSQVNNIII